MRRERPPAGGLALPLVLVLGAACQWAVGVLLDSVRSEVSSSAGLTRADQALNLAESSLGEAAARLAGPLVFPPSNCAAGLCANRQAPALEAYDWQSGKAHAKATAASTGAYWIEALGIVNAGHSADCPGETGGCEYVRVIASAAAGSVRRTLEAAYRIRRVSDAPPQVRRITWRDAMIP